MLRVVRIGAANAAMLAVGVGLFGAVCRWGPAGLGTAPATVATRGVEADGTFLHVLVALAAVLLTARVLGVAMRWLGQPAVIAEVLAGIALGPSVLGRVAPSIAAFVLPAGVAPGLGLLAQTGVVLFMFLVGLEFDAGLLRRHSHVTLAVSQAGIVVPFVLGAVLAAWCFPALAGQGTSFGVFAYFMGISMSVTAFPVLARILVDVGIQRSRLGALALSCAAIDDVTAWCLLALGVSVARQRSGGALATPVLTAAYVAAMAWVVRPRLLAFVRRRWGGEVTQGLTAFVMVAVLACGAVTELIGIHALFGAFSLGAVLSAEPAVARALRARLEDLVVVLLLPAFFAFTGMRTQIGLVSGGAAWLLCGAIVLVACAGKLGGITVAARAAGLPWRDATALGVLMNTRGLMELVVLNIGLDLGILSPPLFAMMVVMALATTLATVPLLHALAPAYAASPADAAFAPEA